MTPRVNPIHASSCDLPSFPLTGTMRTPVRSLCISFALDEYYPIGGEQDFTWRRSYLVERVLQLCDSLCCRPLISEPYNPGELRVRPVHKNRRMRGHEDLIVFSEL